VMFGAITHEENRRLKDLNTREIVILIPVVVMIVWMGVFPKFFFKKMDLSVQHFLYDVKTRYEAAVAPAGAGQGPLPSTEAARDVKIDAKIGVKE